jgi:hypothetical protein
LQVVIADRWGVKAAEVARRYPCDAIVRNPAVQAWRGVTVRASTDRVWPWITQIRVAPYSYDWIDNLGLPSPRNLIDLPAPAVGQRFTSAFGGRPAGRILSIEPGAQLTGEIMGWVMSYVLVPESPGATRLLLKLVTARGRKVAPLLCCADLVMARKQLRTLARLAEKGV